MNRYEELYKKWYGAGLNNGEWKEFKELENKDRPAVKKKPTRKKGAKS
uniref:Uncharacterized protein n=1 Tax=viral metagenome TaxID=1070528 RepID=A0A6H2A2G8_9ZZZZ